MNKPVYLILFILIVLSLQSCALYNAARHPTPEAVNKASADRMKLFKNIKKDWKNVKSELLQLHEARVQAINELELQIIKMESEAELLRKFQESLEQSSISKHASPIFFKSASEAFEGFFAGISDIIKEIRESNYREELGTSFTQLQVKHKSKINNLKFSLPQSEAVILLGKLMMTDNEIFYDGIEFIRKCQKTGNKGINKFINNIFGNTFDNFLKTDETLISLNRSLIKHITEETVTLIKNIQAIDNRMKSIEQSIYATTLYLEHDLGDIDFATLGQAIATVGGE